MNSEEQSLVETKSPDKGEILTLASEVFQNVEREAIVHVLIETMHRKGVTLYGKVAYTDVLHTIEELANENKIHMIFYTYPQECVDELSEMRREGMLKVTRQKGVLKTMTIVPDTKLAQVVGKFIQG